jgi:hypothetical protein
VSASQQGQLIFRARPCANAWFESGSSENQNWIRCFRAGLGYVFYTLNAAHLYAFYIFAAKRPILNLQGTSGSSPQITIGGNPMTSMPIEGAKRLDTPAPNAPGSDIPLSLRVIGSVLRIVFIASLLAITVRVALPQSETIWTVYDTPGDLVRLALGLGVCIWVAVQLFWAPKDRNSYQTWVYVGLAAVPLALIFLIAIW